MGLLYLFTSPIYRPSIMCVILQIFPFVKAGYVGTFLAVTFPFNFLFIKVVSMIIGVLSD
jgi:hypothetical protein